MNKYKFTLTDITTNKLEDAVIIWAAAEEQAFLKFGKIEKPEWQELNLNNIEVSCGII